MLCIPIQGPSFPQVKNQMEEACKIADVLEMRFDMFNEIPINKIQELISACARPVILTARPNSQGGKFVGNEKERLEKIRNIAHLRPAYIDLEYDMPLDFIRQIKMENPRVSIILSYHDFEKTPTNLDDILKKMKEKPADIYKLACMTHSTLDSLRLVEFQQNNGKNAAIMGMGTYGYITRILGKIKRSPIVYASLRDELQTAPGQLSADKLIDVYHFRSLNPSTTIYGLIGNPTERSIGHLFHNDVMKTLRLGSVYLKMDIKQEELTDFFKLAKSIDIMGLSVTMPLKEDVYPLMSEMDQVAKEIGAVNTISISNEELLGFNTDGYGAIEAIEEVLPVSGKTMLILGAGGAAKAVIYMAKRKGAHVIVLNRTKEKADAIADEMGCQSDSLDRAQEYFAKGVDIVVNCTPESMPLSDEIQFGNAVAMDLKTRPAETDFLKHARKQGCKVIYGYRMFYYQALRQLEIWFGVKPEVSGPVAEKWSDPARWG